MDNKKDSMTANQTEEIRKHVQISEEEFENEEIKNARTSLRELRAKYGL